MVYSAIFLFMVTFLFFTCIQNKDNQVSTNYEESNLGHLLTNEDLQLLGEKLFFDETLSSPVGQSCATCHGPEVGWTGPDENINKGGGVYPGAFAGRFGNRKPNSAAYATLSPVFHAVNNNGIIEFEGGNFWDGRATGHILGNPSADQAQGPFLNPLEQNIASAGELVDKVSNSEYAYLFNKAGRDIWGIDEISKSDDVNLKFGIIGLAIAAFEHSEKVNSFTSKFDFYLQGKIKLTDNEKKGLELFNGKAKCALCHPAEIGPDGYPPLFTDFRFDNLGIPANPQNQWYSMDSTLNPEGAAWTDPGLKGFIELLPQYAMFADESYGKHQAPTLRNVDKRPSENYVKAYGHNGYFKSLEEIVHFYNTRDVLPQAKSVSGPRIGINCWPEPEVAENVNVEETGNLGLTPGEESLIVEFLKTLSDGYVVDSKE